MGKLKLNFLSAVLDSAVTFTRAGATATCVNASGHIQSVAADTPRFDYDPSSLACHGLLVEEARTNLFNYSQTLDDAFWSKTRLNTTGAPAWVNQAISPDGTQNADKLIEDTATNTHYIQRTYAAAASTTYTFSVFLKAAERAFARVQVGLFASQVAPNPININLTTGEFTANDTNRTVVRSFGNGWWRISTTVTTIASAVNIAPSVYVASALGTTNYTGDGSSGIYAWGMQLEEGAFPTSYIPVEASSLTRNEDVAVMTGANFSDWWQAGKGGVLAHARPSTVSGTRPWLQFDDGTTNESITLRGNATNPELYIVDGGTPQVQIDAGTIEATTEYALTCWWDADDCKARLDGGAVLTDASATIPTVTQARLGSDGTNYLNGHLASISYYDVFSQQIYTRRKNKAIFNLM